MAIKQTKLKPRKRLKVVDFRKCIVSSLDLECFFSSTLKERSQYPHPQKFLKHPKIEPHLIQYGVRHMEYAYNFEIVDPNRLW